MERIGFSIHERPVKRSSRFSMSKVFSASSNSKAFGWNLRAEGVRRATIRGFWVKIANGSIMRAGTRGRCSGRCAQAQRRRISARILTLLMFVIGWQPAIGAETDLKIERFDHATINVRDLQRAAVWYESTLKFTPSKTTPDYIVLGHGNAVLVLNKASVDVPSRDAAMTPGIFHVAFSVAANRFWSAVGGLRERGVDVEVVADDEHENAYFRDPEGNWLELTAIAPDPHAAPSAALRWLADRLLARLEATNISVRLQRRLPFDRFPDFTPGHALEEARFNRHMLERLKSVSTGSLPHQEMLLAGILKQSFESGTTADLDYWFTFAVTPYAGGSLIQSVHQGLSAASVASPDDRRAYVKLLQDYAGMVLAMRDKTVAQSGRKIRVSKAAIPGVIATLKGLRESASTSFEAKAERASDVVAAAELRSAVHDVINSRILPAYDALIGVFDEHYLRSAPDSVGVGQYAAGKDYYRRRIAIETGLTLSPQAIHAMGESQVAELDRRLADVRKAIGFKGDREAFHVYLRTNSRFLATSPADVESRYSAHVDRIKAKLPAYFITLPRSEYGIERLNPAAEAGMTYGYYEPPTQQHARGIYFYNGSNLASRSLVTSAHLIYHELMPGHHLRIASAAENTDQHPLLSVLSFGAFEEGWAEYAANLGVEMGVYEDPFDLYGHLVSQAFLASRLVVDTGMNYLGWSRDRAQKYMHDHTFESDRQIGTETLRYSTDIPAQALDYRLGYQTLIDGRRKAERSLGAHFDIKAFNSSVSNSGAMPLNVLNQHIDWIIDTQAGKPVPAVSESRP